MASTRTMTETHCIHRDCIAPADVRYIKLGPGNAWADECLAKGRLPLGHHDAPHDAAEGQDWDCLKGIWTGQGLSGSKASDFLREVREFYTLGTDCLWITFAMGHMWWANAHPDVIAEQSIDRSRPSRFRRVIGAWSRCDINGDPISITSLSTRLTSTTGYRQTICRVAAQELAIRRINDEELESVAAARNVRTSFQASLVPIIQALHQNDFELMVDLTFTRLGWLRESEVGGLQKDVDMVMRQPLTGERALIQVKSRIDQAGVDLCAAKLAPYEIPRCYLICHSPDGDLTPPTAMPGLAIWTSEKLALHAIQAGLVDWLFARAG